MLDRINLIGGRPVVVSRECAECFSLWAPRPHEKGVSIREANAQEIILADGRSVPLLAIGLVDPKLTV